MRCNALILLIITVPLVPPFALFCLVFTPQVTEKSPQSCFASLRPGLAQEHHFCAFTDMILGGRFMPYCVEKLIFQSPKNNLSLLGALNFEGRRGRPIMPDRSLWNP